MEQPVWYDKKSMANVLSFAQLLKQYHITYNNKVKDAFIVTTDMGQVKFPQSTEGLYSYRFSKGYKEKVKTGETQLVSTVAEN